MANMASTFGRRARSFKGLSHCLLSTAGFAEKLSFTNWTAAKSAATFFPEFVKTRNYNKMWGNFGYPYFSATIEWKQDTQWFLGIFFTFTFEESFNQQVFPLWTVFIDLFWLPRRHAGEVQVAQTSAQCQQAPTPELNGRNSTKCRTCPRGVRSRSSQRICSWRIKGSAPCPIAACRFSQNWSETWFQFLAAKELNRFWGRLCKLCITSNVKIITMNCWRPL